MANALPLQWLLKLPPSLRFQSISPLTTGIRALEKRIHIQRGTIKRQSFSTTGTTQAKSPKFRKPSSPSNKQTPRPPPPNSPDAAPPGSPPSQRLLSNMPPQILRLLHTKGSVLLYHAPNHTSFFIYSYLLGGTFLVGAVAQAGFIEERAKEIPWPLRVTTTFIAVFWAIVGTVFILGPTKMIRTVHLVSRPANQGYAGLRFQIRSRIPFIDRIRGASNKKVIETPMREVFIGEKVFSNNIPIKSVPLTRAEEFTAFEVNPPKLTMRERFGVIGHYIRRFFPTLLQDTRRMFLRDGMAYLSIPARGNWKLDIHGALLLDEGRPLIAVMFPVEAIDRAWVTTLTRLFRR